MSITVKDLILRLAISDHAPATLNPGFVQGAGVVPPDWTLAQEPICTAEGSQLVYDNGLILLAQGQLLSGQQPLDRPGVGESELVALLVRYVQALPLLRYQGLQTQLRVVVTYENDPDAARRVVCERLLQPGDWQTLGSEPMQPTLQFTYPLGDQVLNLTLAQAQVRQEGQPVGSALVFAGAFDQLLGDGPKVPQLEALLRGWTVRRDLLLDLISNRFQCS
jgi:hypothetical protein